LDFIFAVNEILREYLFGYTNRSEEGRLINYMPFVSNNHADLSE